jgi:hypothetical protein
LKFGETATFTYKTVYAPIEVHTSVSGAGLSSDGVTLGMVPEPASYLSLLGALAPLVLLRRRTKS